MRRHEEVKKSLDCPRDFQVLYAAYLRTQKPSGAKKDEITKPVTQEEIAEKLNIRQPEVARLLMSAEEFGWLDQSPRFSEEFPVKLLEEMKARFFVFEALKEAVENITSDGAKTTIHVTTGSDFPKLAAAELATLLQRSRQVGVTFGHTLADIVDSLLDAKDMVSISHLNLRFLPLSGMPVHLAKNDKDFRYHSTYLADRLQERVKTSDSMPMLNAVPAYISSDFVGERLDAIRSFIEGIPGYVEVFGVRDPLGRDSYGRVRDVDTILTSVGLVADDDELTGTFVRERFLQETPRFLYSDLKKWVFGDIAGILLPREGIDASARATIDGMNDRWVGMRLSHVISCVERAARDNLPGVVVFAHQPEKAEIIEQLIRRSLVSHLIVDADLAKELEDRLCPGRGRS